MHAGVAVGLLALGESLPTSQSGCVMLLTSWLCIAIGVAMLANGQGEWYAHISHSALALWLGHSTTYNSNLSCRMMLFLNTFSQWCICLCISCKGRSCTEEASCGRNCRWLQRIQKHFDWYDATEGSQQTAAKVDSRLQSHTKDRVAHTRITTAAEIAVRQSHHSLIWY